MKINQISPQEAKFTEVLESIALTPKMLYFYGKMPENVLNGSARVLSSSPPPKVAKDNFWGVPSGDTTRAEAIDRLPAIAIVGARKNTPYGEKIAFEAAYAAAKAGAVVVSGLALGIDSIAHRGALAAGGLTVAVLGTPIDRIHPRRHEGLAREIVAAGGCVMSELAVGESFIPKTSFLQRNRIISGLADVVLVVEAAERSGSLNTAAHALDQGREVLAVPGRVGDVMSEGCNKLIRQGAGIYTEVDDLLNLLFPERLKESKKKVVKGDTPAETAILKMLQLGVDDGEKIAAKSGLKIAELNQAITMLEIKGRVKALGANRWMMVK